MSSKLDPYADPLAGAIWKELSASSNPLPYRTVAKSLGIKSEPVRVMLVAMYDVGLVGRDRDGAYWPIDSDWAGADTSGSAV